MPITITVEDGSIVEGANSYLGPDELLVYASNRGVDLENDEQTKAWLITAVDYLNTYGPRWRGVLVTADQPMQWPRDQVWRDEIGDWLDASTIPQGLINAQAQLVMAQSTGLVLLPNQEGGVLPVIREKVDVLETEYARPVDAGFPDSQPRFPVVDALLAPLLVATGFSLRTVRI